MRTPRLGTGQVSSSEHRLDAACFLTPSVRHAEPTHLPTERLGVEPQDRQSRLRARWTETAVGTLTSAPASS